LQLPEPILLFQLGLEVKIKWFLMGACNPLPSINNMTTLFKHYPQASAGAQPEVHNLFYIKLSQKPSSPTIKITKSCS
jgi:hypothetical protein